MAYLYLALAFSLNATANIFLKIGSLKGLETNTFNPVTLAVHNWHFIVGCVLFAVNIIFYFLALRSLPLSVAYPIMIVMSFVIINSYAFFGLGEAIVPIQVLGYVLLIIGLVLVVGFAR